jgi:hypothetical protein
MRAAIGERIREEFVGGLHPDAKPAVAFFGPLWRQLEALKLSAEPVERDWADPDRCAP